MKAFLSLSFKVFVGSIILMLPYFSYAQVKLLKEIKISDEVMFFDGVNNENSTNKDVNAPYDYSFGSALTPHGDCIKAYKEFVFMTWYRGGKEDRHVMLTRYNMNTGVMKTIEFPHQHTGFEGKWWVGETHNTIAVGICPKDETIHLVYDLHRNGTVQQFVDADDCLRYSYSIKGGAVVADDDFILESTFVNSSKGNYKHSSFHGITDMATTNMLTYPAFFTNDEGDLFLKNRHGYAANGKLNFCMYNGTEWEGYTDFNKSNQGGGELNGAPSTHNWGIYGDMKYLNGKIRIGFQQRLGNKTDKYIYQNGVYYAYTDDPSGKTHWKDYKGTEISSRTNQYFFYEPHRIKVAEPGDFVQTTQKDMVYIVGGFDWTVTDNEDIHLVSEVKDKQYNVTKKLHTYKSADATEFTTVEYNAGSELYAAGNDVYLIGLKGGRVNIVKTEGGKSDFKEVYQHTTGATFDKSAVYVNDGKAFLYLKKAGGTGANRTTYLQIFDLDLPEPGPYGPSGYTHAANEGDTVEVSGTVDIAYGAKGDYVYLYDQTENCGCDSVIFGSNPAPGEDRHCYIKPVVFAEGVSLNKKILALTIGKSETLIATITPNDTKNKTLSWTSQSPTIASISQDGEVTAIALGSANVVVKTDDGGFIDNCVINVVDEVFPNIEFRDDEQIPNAAINLLDGKTDDDHRWSAQVYPKSVVIDYGKSLDFIGSKLYAYQDRSYHYTIAISESPDSDFTTVVDQSGEAASQPITHTFDKTTGRYVKLTVTGCTNYANNWVSINELEMDTTITSGVSEMEFAHQISIYPNPADQVLNISLPNKNEISDVKIISLCGQELLYKQTVGKASSIDIKDLPQGVYIISIAFEEFQYTNRFIKK